MPVGVLGGVYLSEYGALTAQLVDSFRRRRAQRRAFHYLGHGGLRAGGRADARLFRLAGGIVLGMMMIPLIMRTTEEVLLLVPDGYREAALALGIARWRTIVQIVVRTALKGIVTGILLALARVAGETAPLLFTAFGNRFWNHNLSDPIAALPLQIFNYAISPYDDWHRQAWAGALVLLLLVLAIKSACAFSRATGSNADDLMSSMTTMHRSTAVPPLPAAAAGQKPAAGAVRP